MSLRPAERWEHSKKDSLLTSKPNNTSLSFNLLLHVFGINTLGLQYFFAWFGSAKDGGVGGFGLRGCCLTSKRGMCWFWEHMSNSITTSIISTQFMNQERRQRIEWFISDQFKGAHLHLEIKKKSCFNIIIASFPEQTSTKSISTTNQKT